MTNKKATQFRTDVEKMIKELSGKDYITNYYSNIGIDSLIILSSVFRADQSYLGNYLVDVLNKKKEFYLNKDVFDLGCGCGLLGIICALNGAKIVYLSDINPRAIKNSKLNSILLDINNVFFYFGDMFSPIPTNVKFDVIIFNPPTISGKPSNFPESAFIRTDDTMISFYKLFPEYLKENGIVIMPSSSRFDDKMNSLNMAKYYHYSYKIIAEKKERDGNYKYIIKIKKP